jgi:hypothetical protein
MQEFPEWVPDVIVDYYNDLLSTPFNIHIGIFSVPTGWPGKKNAPTLHLLITDPQMQSVWRSITKRAAKGRGEDAIFEFCDQVLLWHERWKHEDKRTPAQIQNAYTRCAEALEKACLAIQNELGDEWRSTIEKFPASWDVGRPVRKKQRYSVAKSLGYSTEPCLAMSRLAQYIRLSADYLEEPIVKKPQSQNAHVVYFVRHLSEFMKDEFGTPLHEHVATTARTVFKSEIDGDHVRKLIRNKKYYPGSF